MTTCVTPQCGPFGNKTYGPRTVIVPADPIIWSAETSYPYLTLVASADFGQSYISKKDVPSGTPLENTDYWIPAAQFNAQLAKLQNELNASIGAINSIYKFEGDTLQEKFFNALDTVTMGTILIGDITIDSVYSAKDKDYRKITVMGGALTINVNHWFNQSASTYNTTPAFSDCTIDGMNNTFFNTGNCLGPIFRNCTMRNVTIYNDSENYIQSPYFVGCDMNPVNNLITCDSVYDLKIDACRIESAADTLINAVSTSIGISQGTITNSLIEGRTNCVIVCGATTGLVVTNNYFEANNGGVIAQTGASSNAQIIFENNSVYAPMNNADYVVNVASGAYANTKIINNITNLPDSKYLFNRIIRVPYAMRNINYGTGGIFPPETNTDVNIVAANSLNMPARWDDSDDTWNIAIKFGNSEFNTSLHPFILMFRGNYGNSQAYGGYVVAYILPRTYYNSSSSAIETTVDVVKIKAVNTNSGGDTTEITASVDKTAYNAFNATISIKISGFTQNNGSAYIIDPTMIQGFYRA